MFLTPLPAIARVVPSLAVLFFAAAALAAEPVDPTGTLWVGPGQVKAKIPSAGSTGGPVTLEIDFGPNGGDLDANEFHLMADDGMEVFDIFGTWTTDAKGQPVLALDTGLLTTELHDLMVHICNDVLNLDPTTCGIIASLDVVTDPSKIKFKLKTSARGPVLSVSGKIPFVLTDGTDSVKLSLSLKSSGPLSPAN